MKYNFLFIIAVAGLMASGCGNGNKQQMQQVEREELVEVTVLHPSAITRTLDISTNLLGYQTVNVAPSVTGRIEHIFVDVGSNVRQGEMLVRMDQNQYNTTKLTHANLQVEIQRMEALRESGSVSQQAYDQTRLSYEQTTESLAFLEKNTFVRAPFSGVISAKNYEDGELYGGQAILVLTQIATLKALIAIPESYYPQVHNGMKVDIHSDIYPDQVFPATVETVYPTVDPATHTFQVKLRIPNGNLRLRPGMYVRTKLEMGDDTAMLVPYSAVQKLTGSNDRYVMLDDGGVAKRVFVTLGQRFDENIEILGDSLSEGDRLVTVGQARLVDGSKLKITQEN